MFRKLGSHDFMWFANSALYILFLLNCIVLTSCLLHAAKAKLFTEILSGDSNLDDWGILLHTFPFKTNLKADDFSTTPKMVKKVITVVDSYKMSSPDCSSGGSEELPIWTLIHVAWSFQSVLEGNLFSRLLENLICGMCV